MLQLNIKTVHKKTIKVENQSYTEHTLLPQEEATKEVHHPYFGEKYEGDDARVHNLDGARYWRELLFTH